ncbi:MAG: RNA polymerase sigma factor region1.1 domain-containing protein, partial [Eubacterium aggregans]
MADDKKSLTKEAFLDELGDESLNAKLMEMPEVQALLKKGKEKGSLNSIDIDGALSSKDLDPEEIDAIYIMLQKNGINLTFKDEPLGDGLDIDINVEELEEIEVD